MRLEKLAHHTMKWTRHALHSCIMARRNSSWLLGLFPVANMGCNPSMVIPPQMSTSRLLGKPARVQRQHRLALSPTRRRCIHFTPEGSPNLRPKRNHIYARSKPRPCHEGWQYIQTLQPTNSSRNSRSITQVMQGRPSSKEKNVWKHGAHDSWGTVMDGLNIP